MFLAALTAIVTILFLAGAKDIIEILRGAIHPYFSPIRIVPGPKSTHWLLGNLKEIENADPGEMHDKWAKDYGPVVKYKAILNIDRLCISDTRAIAHVLAHSMNYEKPAPIRRVLEGFLGTGLLVVEGNTHRDQRRIMNPAFSIPQIRALTDLFLDKALEMKDIWLQKLRTAEFELKPGTVHSGRVDMVNWLSRMALDIIGLAGFGYDFGSLEEEMTEATNNELNLAIRTILRAPPASTLDTLHVLLPFTRAIPSARDGQVKRARAAIDRAGKQFLKDRKAAVRASATANADVVERKDIQDKDILGLLVRANMASDLPESSRMTDDEVLAQIPTMLFAGHETTATAVSWMICTLSTRLDVQDKLRAEALACKDGDKPGMDALGSLPYLDAVVRETMRYHSPVPNMLRVATKDDIIPTEKEWVDTNGVLRSGVQVSKGDSIFIPIRSINRSKEIWGEDAHEFKPERWTPELLSATSSVPGVWGNVLSFSGGNRACIGWRFSLFEMKAIVYTLIRSFHFELAVSPDDIKMKSSAVTRPHLKDDIDAGPQMPVWVTPVAESAA